MANIEYERAPNFGAEPETLAARVLIFEDESRNPSEALIMAGRNMHRAQWLHPACLYRVALRTPSRVHSSIFPY